MRYILSSMMLALFGVLLTVPGVANSSAPFVNPLLSHSSLNGSGMMYPVKVEIGQNGQTSSTNPRQSSVVADPDSPNVQKGWPKPGTVVADPDSPNVRKRRPKPGTVVADPDSPNVQRGGPKPGTVVADPDSPNVHPRGHKGGNIPHNRNNPGRPNKRPIIRNRQR